MSRPDWPPLMDLAECETWLRSLVGGNTYTAHALGLILREYDARGAVAEAARAVYTDCGNAERIALGAALDALDGERG